jgi:hypothetical protein
LALLCAFFSIHSHPFFFPKEKKLSGRKKNAAEKKICCASRVREKKIRIKALRFPRPLFEKREKRKNHN